MLGESCKLGIRSRAGKYLGISLCSHASPLAFERSANDRGPAAPCPRVNDLVDESNELIGQAYGNLLAHPNMVANLYQHTRLTGAWTILEDAGIDPASAPRA
jgi:hypothetical protein